MRTLPDQKRKQVVYEKVTGFVLSSTVNPGDKIDEAALALELGVSKTPVREVLFKLSHDGLVTVIPNKGYFKAKLSMEDVLDIMETRELLEGLAVRRAAENATARDIKEMRALHKPFDGGNLEAKIDSYLKMDDEFHSMLFRLSGRPRLIHILQELNNFNIMLRRVLFSSAERVKVSTARHYEIIEALEARQADRAEKLMRKTIRSSRRYLMGLLADAHRTADSSANGIK